MTNPGGIGVILGHSLLDESMTLAVIIHEVDVPDLEGLHVNVSLDTPVVSIVVSVLD